MPARSQRVTTTTTTGEIPDKMYFRIGEVADIVGVKPYVLRYWETEFPSLRPQKSRTRQRMYRRRDVELLLSIKHLLYERKYTIAGARQLLRKGLAGLEALVAAQPNEVVAEAPVSTPPAALTALPQVVEPAPQPVVTPSPAELAQATRDELSEQLAFDLRVPLAMREDLRRCLEDLLRLCDDSEIGDEPLPSPAREPDLSEHSGGESARARDVT